MPTPEDAPRPTPDDPFRENDEISAIEDRLSLLVTDTDMTSIQPAGLIRQDEQPRNFRGVLTTAQGAVLRVDSGDRSVLIRCPDEGRAMEGTFITVRRDFFTGPASIGTLKIVSAEPGYVVAVPHRMTRAVKTGDEAVLFMQVP